MRDETRPTSPIAERLAQVGRVLYGERWWRLALARAIGRDDETIRRWMTGHTELTADHGVFDNALELLRRRASEISAEADALERWISSRRKKGQQMG